jgi:hypothetical protein
MADAPLIPVSRLFRFACPEDVTQMPAQKGGHHCKSCRKTVVDMSQLTPEEAVAKVRISPKSTCVSYAFAADGRLVFRAAKRASGPVMLTMAAFLAACQPGADASALSDAADAHSAEVTERCELPPPPAASDPQTVRAGEPLLAPPVAPQLPSEPRAPQGLELAPTTSWPSATQSTAPAKPPAVVALHRVPAPPVVKPPPIRRTAGKPVRHFAGGLGDMSDEL